jgi:hypothetical protein
MLGLELLERLEPLERAAAILSPGKTKAKGVATADGVAPVPDRCTQVLRKVAPGTAAHHTLAAFVVIDLQRLRSAWLFILVEAPLPNVASHIEHALLRGSARIHPYGGCTVEPTFVAITSRRFPATGPWIFARWISPRRCELPLPFGR